MKPELPPPVNVRYYWTPDGMERGVSGVWFLDAEAQAYGLACYLAGMERAAVIAEQKTMPDVRLKFDWGFNSAAAFVAAAIRKEAGNA